MGTVPCKTCVPMHVHSLGPPTDTCVQVVIMQPDRGFRTAMRKMPVLARCAYVSLSLIDTEMLQHSSHRRSSHAIIIIIVTTDAIVSDATVCDMWKCADT